MNRQQILVALALTACGALAATDAQAGIGGFIAQGWLTALTIAVAGIIIYLIRHRK